MSTATDEQQQPQPQPQPQASVHCPPSCVVADLMGTGRALQPTVTKALLAGGRPHPAPPVDPAVPAHRRPYVASRNRSLHGCTSWGRLKRRGQDGFYGTSPSGIWGIDGANPSAPARAYVHTLQNSVEDIATAVASSSARPTGPHNGMVRGPWAALAEALPPGHPAATAFTSKETAVMPPPVLDFASHGKKVPAPGGARSTCHFELRSLLEADALVLKVHASYAMAAFNEPDRVQRAVHVLRRVVGPILALRSASSFVKPHVSIVVQSPELKQGEPAAPGRCVLRSIFTDALGEWRAHATYDVAVIPDTPDALEAALTAALQQDVGGSAASATNVVAEKPAAIAALRPWALPSREAGPPVPTFPAADGPLHVRVLSLDTETLPSRRERRILFRIVRGCVDPATMPQLQLRCQEWPESDILVVEGPFACPWSTAGVGGTPKLPAPMKKGTVAGPGAILEATFDVVTFEQYGSKLGTSRPGTTGPAATSSANCPFGERSYMSPIQRGAIWFSMPHEPSGGSKAVAEAWRARAPARPPLERYAVMPTVAAELRVDGGGDDDSMWPVVASKTLRPAVAVTSGIAVPLVLGRSASSGDGVSVNSLIAANPWECGADLCHWGGSMAAAFGRADGGEEGLDGSEGKVLLVTTANEHTALPVFTVATVVSRWDLGLDAIRRSRIRTAANVAPAAGGAPPTAFPAGITTTTHVLTELAGGHGGSTSNSVAVDTSASAALPAKLLALHGGAMRALVVAAAARDLSLRIDRLADNFSASTRRPAEDCRYNPRWVKNPHRRHTDKEYYERHMSWPSLHCTHPGRRDLAGFQRTGAEAVNHSSRFSSGVGCRKRWKNASFGFDFTLHCLLLHQTNDAATMAAVNAAMRVLVEGLVFHPLRRTLRVDESAKNRPAWWGPGWPEFLLALPRATPSVKTSAVRGLQGQFVDSAPFAFWARPPRPRVVDHHLHLQSQHLSLDPVHQHLFDVTAHYPVAVVAALTKGVQDCPIGSWARPAYPEFEADETAAAASAASPGRRHRCLLTTQQLYAQLYDPMRTLALPGQQIKPDHESKTNFPRPCPDGTCGALLTRFWRLMVLHLDAHPWHGREIKAEKLADAIVTAIRKLQIRPLVVPLYQLLFAVIVDPGRADGAAAVAPLPASTFLRHEWTRRLGSGGCGPPFPFEPPTASVAGPSSTAKPSPGAAVTRPLLDYASRTKTKSLAVQVLFGQKETCYGARPLFVPRWFILYACCEGHPAVPARPALHDSKAVDASTMLSLKAPHVGADARRLLPSLFPWEDVLALNRFGNPLKLDAFVLAVRYDAFRRVVGAIGRLVPTRRALVAGAGDRPQTTMFEALPVAVVRRVFVYWHCSFGLLAADE